MFMGHGFILRRHLPNFNLYLVSILSSIILFKHKTNYIVDTSLIHVYDSYYCLWSRLKFKCSNNITEIDRIVLRVWGTLKYYMWLLSLYLNLTCIGDGINNVISFMCLNSILGTKSLSGSDYAMVKMNSDPL